MRTQALDIQTRERLAPLIRFAAASAILLAAFVSVHGAAAATDRYAGATATLATPDQVGQWAAPVPLPLVAVHMSMEPNGQVLMIDGWDAAVNTERLYDPVFNTSLLVGYGRNLFCAGHVQLADGRTLIVGGNVQADAGLADTTIFDSKTDAYTRQADMSVARWYPTATALPDGRVLVFAGDNIVTNRGGQPHYLKDASVNSLPEIFNPKTNTWTDLTSATLTSTLYPFMFVLSDGRVFDAGPDTTTRILDPNNQTWTTVGTSPIDGMGAVMYRPNKIMKAGTWADPDFNGSLAYNADGGTAVIDMSQPSPQWRTVSPMAFGRSYNNLTILADGTVLASGGESTSEGTDLTHAVMPAEIWNPDTETWTTVASLTNGREYHSTAILLPDGRVMMGGGGALPGRATDTKNAEIYSPPYLFKGARPSITSAPSGAGYGSSLTVTTPDAASITKVSFIRAGSVTHGFDENQRFQFLNFTAGSGQLTVQAPASSNLAPPGDYLMYLINASGVPSTGAFVRMSASGDVTPPTAPTNVTASGSQGKVTLTWSASTDAGGVARYSVYRSITSGFTPGPGNLVAQTSATTLIDGGLTAGPYYYKINAEDVGGNVGPFSAEASATVPSGAPPGLVAAYGFDEGTGATVTDQAGHGNNGTITNATWAGAGNGKFGNALSFNGTNASVSIPDSTTLDVTGGMTIEAWVDPTTTSAFRTVALKETTGNLDWGLYAGSDTNKPQSQVNVAGQARLLDDPSAIPTAQWTHLAMTYDGATQRLYVNGTQVASANISGTIATSSNPMKIGGNAIWGEWFNGLIDEVRVYNRALSAAEVQQDMTTSVSSPDTTPPSVPGTLTATGGLGQVGLSWGPATDNVGVAKYDVYRSTTSGFTPGPANRLTQVTGTSYTDSGLAAGAYFYRVAAEDSAGNIGPVGNQASGNASADTTPPTAPTSVVATASPGQVLLNWTAATDAGGIARYSVYRSLASGFIPSASNRIGQPTGTTYTDTGLTPGAYYYKITADDNAGNTGPSSSEVSAVVPNGPAPGLVAAYGFDEGSGTTVTDQSGKGNTGTITNATWAGSAAGKFGNALSFNGTNASVAIPNSTSLTLTSAMTIEAWIKPTVTSGFRSVAMKETSGNIDWGLYAGSDANKPQSQVNVAGQARLLDDPSTITAGAWTHLGMTYDGTTQRLYVNGTQVASSAISGTILTSTQAMKIGGNAIWGEWFNGQIDEVRVYNRALAATEIQADMNTSITSPDAIAPTAPGTLLATNGVTSIALAWGPSTDNVGVTRYDVYRSTTSGFTPGASNRVAQPAGTSYTDTGLAAGTYFYRVAAEDAAGNISAFSNEASATAGDSSPPTAPGLLTATGGTATASLSWGTATDNVGVVKYDIYRSTTSGFAPSAANRVAQPTGTTYNDTTLAAGTYYYRVAAEDAAGNVGPPTNEASAVITGDTSPPTAPSSLAGTVAGSTVNLSWTASSDNVGVTKYDVYRGTTSGFTPTPANRIAQPTGTTYSDAGLALGAYYYKVAAEDAAGNVSGVSNELSASVADAAPPTAPGGLAASPSGTTISLTWTAATDNVGVVKYDVYRGTTSTFTPSASNRIGQPTATSFSDTSVAPGTWYYVVAAEDAAGNIGPSSNTASATILDTTPPGPLTGLAASGGSGQASLTWTAATDNVGVAKYDVYRSTTSGFTPGTSNRIAQPTGTTYADTGLAAGTYYYRVAAEDAAANVGAASAQVSATVSAAPPNGLVAAYGFDEATGSTVTDQSGHANDGTTTNTSWAGAGNGKFGNALVFNGTNASVNVPDSNSLDLTTGMTIEAWVKPNAASSYRTVLVKETAGNLDWGLYGNNDASRPEAQANVGGSAHLLNGTAALATGTWTHVAATYDGSTLRMFVNGAQVSSLAIAGSLLTSTGAMKIGGNSIWGEWFNGLIDEVRVYNRALAATEIQTDMNSSISSPDTQAPTAPGTLTATGGLGQISLAWGAATDNVGIGRYDLYRSTTAGFTPAPANRIAQPAGTSYTDTGLVPATYYYVVAAEDAAGNIGPPSNQASGAAAADTTPPTVSLTAPAAGATVSGTTTVTATASDNGTVAGVTFKVDGVAIGSEDTATPYSISWDTFGAGNGPHTLTALARDGAGNTTTSTSTSVTVSNTGSPGLVGAWAFDETTGTTAADQSGKGNNGTIANATHVTTGKFNGALSFNGTTAMVTAPDSNTLDLTTGMTLEAWLKPSVAGGWQTAVAKEQPGGLAYGMYESTNVNFPEAEVYTNGATKALNGTGALPLNAWSHLAATYDGATLRLYVNGTQVSSSAVSGSIIASTGALRIGGNSIWGEHFTGLIDEVRIYNRALGAAEIQSDMQRSVTPDTTPPTILSFTPSNGAAGINAGSPVTVKFNEAMNAGSITTSTFQVNDPSNNAVPATVSYDPTANTATLTPTTAMQYGTTYTVSISGAAGGVTDLAGNSLAATATWTFTTEASPPPVLVVTSTANLFSSYLGEIMRAEGMNDFTTIDASLVTPTLLNGFDVVVLGDTTLNAAQVTTLTDWVNGGGSLIASHPDKQLASLLGLTYAASSLTNAYLKVDATTAPGAGIVGQTIQFHGTADKYTLAGATAIATLYSNSTTATANPAVTLRSVGPNGGQAAAFTYDLAKSVVLTRQGNPAWASQERDGQPGLRPDDMFFGAKAGDVQPDWVDTTKVAIPQADEQQRLLVNLMTIMERRKLPLPHFWYLPRGLKAAIVMSGDDHSPGSAPGGTVSIFNRFISQSAPGCVVSQWQCIRATSNILPDGTLTDAQAKAFIAQGFEITMHPTVASCPTTVQTYDQITTIFDQQLAQFAARYPDVPPQVSNRTHCVYWPDWLTAAKVEAAHGMRMDANYYAYPGGWAGSNAGFMTGGGFPMRFADTDGTTVDVYQEMTHIDDEATTQTEPAVVNSLLDAAAGPNGYYGAFGVNIHTDQPAPNANDDAIIASAQTHGVPVISYKQLLDWTDGRNASTIRALSWNAAANTFTFVTTVGNGATGLQTMLPVQGPVGALTGITSGGSSVAYTVQTIKGIQYAMFNAATGTFVASYG